jgi:hypothetical protein
MQSLFPYSYFRPFLKSFLLLLAFLLLFHLAFPQSENRLLNLKYGKYKVGLFQNKIRYNNSVEFLINIWQAGIKNQYLNIIGYGII